MGRRDLSGTDKSTNLYKYFMRFLFMLNFVLNVG
jgi:hypothetical protein